MQVNSNIIPGVSSESANPYIDVETSGWSSGPEPAVEPHRLVADTSSAWDYQFPNSATTLDLPFLRRLPPYAGHSDSRKTIYDLSKRSVDLVGSVLLLLLTMPLLVVVAVCIKLTSPGPVLFRHKRLGHGGKEFYFTKFRTMVVDAEERLNGNAQLRRQFEEKFKLDDDPRITRLGAFLRKTSIDELPQLFHVFRGEMTLIGPRPIEKAQLGKYTIYGNKLLTVKPGLGGLWQTCGRSQTTHDERVLMDMYYIDHRCLSLDLRLLLKTALVVLRRSGAY
jgi:lipopolysaccharide/colanic/teichoic acid biosynthesis glycosyltransferase